MPIDYPKNQIKPKDRRIVTSGPRDRQMKQQAMYSAEAAAKIEALQEKIEELVSKSPVKGGGYSDEEVNTAVIKAVKEEIARVDDKHNLEKEKLISKITTLQERIEATELSYKAEIVSLKNIISAKDAIINQIKEMSNFSDNKLTTLFKELSEKIGTYRLEDQLIENDRPKMETQFIDPIDKESTVEKHFELDKIEKNSGMSNKLDKLKGLVGSKLPST